MSFLLKSPRLATGLVGFARQAEFSFRKREILLNICQNHFKVNKTFVRSCALAPQSNVSSSKPNAKETLYQKSALQVYRDIKYKGYISVEDLNDAWHSLKFSTNYTTEQTALLIKSCGHSLPEETSVEKLKLVKEIWDSFDKIGVNKTISHYNALLDVYNELEYGFSPKDFLSNLKKQGLHPDLATYKKLLHALSIQGNIGSSQELLEHMKMHSVRIDDGIFNSLILGCSLQGDFISAHGIIELMKEKQLTLSSESYVNFALGYAKLGDIEKVKEIMYKCQEEVQKFYITEFLEIAYTFAVNGHSEHFSAFLDLIELEKNFPTVSTNVIHRLLHKKLDKEAFALFELRNKLGPTYKVQEPLQMFLNHYVKFREPVEVIDMAETYQEKGWSPIALAYCIKETLIRKDIPHCLNFLQVLESRGYPLRIHYFYPILINVHPYGNEEVLKMIRFIHTHNVTFSREGMKSFERFYDFLPGEEFDDLKKLNDAGLNVKLIAWKILGLLLLRKNIDGAVNLVSNYAIAYPAVALPVSMAIAFAKETDYKTFVYILYHLIHNLKANKVTRNMTTEVLSFEYEIFLTELAKVCDETFIIKVLEEMLKKKISVAPSAAAFISAKFPSPEVSDLLSKLRSEELKMKFDKTLLIRLIKMETSAKKGKKNHWSELNEALERNVTVPDVMSIFEDLAKETEFLGNQREEKIVQKLFKYVSLKGDVASAEKIYNFGVQKNIFGVDNYAPCVIAHLARGEINNAMSRYCEGLKASEKPQVLEIIIREIVKTHKHIALNDLEIAISKVLGEYFGKAELLRAFVKIGYSKEASKILQNKSGMVKSLFSAICRELFIEKNVEHIETLEQASRNIANLDLTSLYRGLLRLYANDHSLEKVLKLYVEMVRDDAMKEKHRRLFFDNLKNWDGNVPEKLKKVLQLVLKDCRTGKPSKNTESDSHEKNIFDEERVGPSLGSENESFPNSTDKNDLLNCFYLIQTGKLDKYFKFVREEILAYGSEKAKDYVFCYPLVPPLMKNRKYLDEYEDVVKLGRFSFYWKNYLKLSVRLKDHRRINTAIKNLNPYQLRFCFQEISFKDCLNVIKRADCQRNLGRNLAFFYSKIINQCLKENKFRTAKIYYEKAKKLGLEEFLVSF